MTWGGGGLGDSLTRPAKVVALEVKRKLVSFQGAREGYGVVVNEEGEGSLKSRCQVHVLLREVSSRSWFPNRA